MRIYFETSSRLQVFVGKRFVEDLNMYDGQSKAQLVREGKWAGAGPDGVYMEQYASLVCACDFGAGCENANKCSYPSNQHGANRYDRSTGMLEILLSGHSIEDFIEVKTLPIVQISLKLSTSSQDFYKIKDSFVSNLAALLRINPTRISIVNIVRGNRRLLEDTSTAVNIEIAPDPVISLSTQSNTQLAVRENDGWVRVTVLRGVNLNGRCSTSFRTYVDLTDSALVGINFVSVEGVAQFESKDTEVVVTIPIISQPGYQSNNATFHIQLLNSVNASIGMSSIQISILNVHAPAPAPPSRNLQPTASTVSFQWSAPVWAAPASDLSSPSRWNLDCSWSRIALGANSVGNLSTLYNASAQRSTAYSASIGGLSSFTRVSCRVAMETLAGIWSDWSYYSDDLLTETICGDGLRQGNEQCDDNNSVYGDGCEDCSVMNGWSCKPGNAYFDLCSQGCGDGVVTVSEQCDDGSNANGDGCNALCQVEIGWNCSASLGLKSTCNSVCGDGIWIPNLEECDTRGYTDGCDSNCKVNPAAVCSNTVGMMSVCRVCGNFKVEDGEVCDDGNVSGACSCNRILPGWSCDDPDAVCKAGPAACSKPASNEVASTYIVWSWLAPNSFGLPILGYEGQIVESMNQTQFNWLLAKQVLMPGTDTSVKTVNLSSSTAYSFRVRACSNVGCGQYSIPKLSETQQPDPSNALLSLSRNFESVVLSTGLAGLGVNVSNMSVQGPAPSPRKCDTTMCTVGKYRGICDDSTPGDCLPCSSGPANTYYVGAGSPYNEDNCSWACNTGFFLPVSGGAECLACNTSSCPVGEFRGVCGACTDLRQKAECSSFSDAKCKLCSGLPANARFTGPGVCAADAYFCLFLGLK